MSKILFGIFVFISCFSLYSQDLKFSKNKIVFAYTEFSSELADTLTIYNDGNNILRIDSIYSVNYYGYKLAALLKDTSIYYFVFGGQDSILLSINQKDSAIFIFSDPSLCPICKKLSKIKAFKDSILFHSNSQNSEYSYLDVQGLGYVSVESKQTKPCNYVLSQNYPNPFNPSTKISWQSPQSGRQTLKVFDVLGKEVATLVDEYRPAGNYEINFDGGNLPSGVYLYKLQAGSFVETKKMIFMK
jgi:hypothetical protein